MKRLVIVWGERLLTGALLVFVAYRLGPQIGALTGFTPNRGDTPTFAVTTLDGASIESGALVGRVVVVNFWATWCGPCRLEMPALQSIAEDFDPEDVVVLGLSTDVGSESGIRAFLAEREITYPVARATWADRQAFGGIAGIPTTFIIDRGGTVRHRVVGYFAPPALRAAVARLLDEPGGSK